MVRKMGLMKTKIRRAGKDGARLLRQKEVKLDLVFVRCCVRVHSRKKNLSGGEGPQLCL